MTRPPLCEAIIQQLIAKSDPLRDSENAGMMHVSAVVELVRDGFASLSLEEVAAAVWDATPTQCEISWKEATTLFKDDKAWQACVAEHRRVAQAFLKLLRKDAA